MQLLIYTSKLTPRISYIINFIFNDILKGNIAFSSDAAMFLQYEGPKFSYAAAPLSDEIFFKQTDFLLSTRIEEVSPGTASFGALKLPFPVEGAALPFDIFAAAFYFITRYEEYLHTKTTNTPFTAANSLQKNLNLLDKPVIDEWALLIKNIIRKKYPAYTFGDKNFAHLPAVNVMLHAPRPNGLIKKSSYFLTALFKRETRKQLFDELTGLGEDPDSNIDFLNTVFRRTGLIPFYFIEGHWDAMASENCKTFISKLKTPSNIGFLSPCPYTENKPLIAAMMGVFNELSLANEPLTQQLEGLAMPGCYLQLLNGGIRADFSMGYANICGFRAGTCTPFYWYDLQLEKESALKVYPYAVSDAALQLLSIDRAQKTYKLLIDRIKLVNGTFCSSWALKSLSENVKFKKWRIIYESILAYA